MSIATMMKTVSDSVHKANHLAKENEWKHVAEAEYTILAYKIKDSAKEEYYYTTYQPNMPYEVYYLLYEKLNNDGFDCDYNGGGDIIVWWDDSDGKEYKRVFS
jgi:hypothetical protein